MHDPSKISANRNVAYYPPNMDGRDFVVGDVHGHFTELERLLAWVDFEPLRDRCFLAGDLVDRGPESERVVEFLSQPWCIAVRGNHDQWCVEAAQGKASATHLRFGGAWFYGCSISEQTEIGNALADLPIAIETSTRSGERIGIVHAECTLASWPQFLQALSGESPEQDAELHASEAIWSRYRFSESDSIVISGVTRIYVGHNVTPLAVRLGNTCYMDTGASTEGGYLSLADISCPGQVHSMSTDGNFSAMTLPLY